MTETSIDRPRLKSYPSRQRSRITNGSLLPSVTDGRSAWVRRVKDIISLHTSDLGGEANCSAAESSIIRRASVIATELEMLEAKFATAGQSTPNDLDLYVRAAGNLRRLLEAVGLRRRQKDVTPSLESYLATKAERSND
jgi:hypothetical protein